MKLESRLLDFIKETPYLNEILERSEDLNISNWYFGAGCICQSYWNFSYGLSREKNIKDIDWVYYDPNDLSLEGEERTQEKVREYFKNLPFDFDVNNQARVHLWYKDIFGYSIDPYKSSEDAIKRWPTTATTVALTKKDNKNIVFAPFGLEDFFALKVRANKAQVTEDIYLKKVARWKNCWPKLNVIPWDKS